MKKTLACFSLFASLAAAAVGGTQQSAAAAATRQSASGFGQVHLGLPLRNFAFSATRSSDGSAAGQAQLENRATGFVGHIQIDCLNVMDNVAVMSGMVTASNSSALPVGSDEIFAVQDNGEGPAAPADEITLAFSGLGPVCTDIPDPALLVPFLFTIESGQIQVHS
jgi:hypothetical protein